MSKMDDLRAMREAKYARSQERGAAARPAVRPAPTPNAAQKATRKAAAPSGKAARAERAEPAAAAPSEELCGHRNMSGRTCTRERGHAAKSHRYS